MSKADFVGIFELLVLAAIVRLGPDAHGMSVLQVIRQRAGRPAPTGAAYTTLDRLEAKGLVRSSLAAPRPERGGRARRRFELTADGRRALSRTLQSVSNMAAGLDLDGDQT